MNVVVYWFKNWYISLSIEPLFVSQSKAFFYNSYINYDVINEFDLFCDSAIVLLLITFLKRAIID